MDSRPSSASTKYKLNSVTWWPFSSLLFVDPSNESGGRDMTGDGL